MCTRVARAITPTRWRVYILLFQITHHLGKSTGVSRPQTDANLSAGAKACQTVLRVKRADTGSIVLAPEHRSNNQSALKNMKEDLEEVQVQ